MDGELVDKLYPTMASDDEPETSRPEPKSDEPQDKPAAEETQGEKAPPDQVEKKAESGAPEGYGDLRIPEGMALDEKGMGEFQTFAKEHDLTPAQAQKLLEFGGAKLKAQLETMYAQWHERNAKWEIQAKTDAEIGGKNFEANISTAKLVFQSGEANPLVKSMKESSALAAALNTTGAGNNPAICKIVCEDGTVHL